MPDVPFSIEAVVARRGRRSRHASADQQWLNSFAQELTGEFATLTTPYLNASAVAIIQAILAKDRDSLEWSDTYNMEVALIELVTRPRLVAWCVSLLKEYEEFAGSAHPLGTKLSDPDKVDDVTLRGSMAQIVSDLHWLYNTVYLQELQRSELTKRLVWIMGGWFVFAMTLGLSSVYWLHHDVPVVLLAIFAGSIGGFISTMQRIQKVPTNGNPVSNIYALDRGWISVYLAPVSGAIFAVLLLLIFIAGLIGNGAMTPVYDSPLATSTQPVDVSSFILNSTPHDGVDFAKVLIWCFIAGFAERFVPDTIDRIVASKDKS